jgi:hypothetical protein
MWSQLKLVDFPYFAIMTNMREELELDKDKPRPTATKPNHQRICISVLSV